MTERNKGGRPKIFKQELADEICLRVGKGQSLNKICQDDHIPCRATIYSWMQENNHFLNNYVKAKADSADAHAEKIMELSFMEGVDEKDPKYYYDAQGNKRVDAQLLKVQIDALKWTASKLKPKKYGSDALLAITEGKEEAGKISMNVILNKDND